MRNKLWGQLKKEKDQEKKSNLSRKPVQKIEQEYNRYNRHVDSVIHVVDMDNVKQSIHYLTDQVERLLFYNYDIKTIAKEMNLGQDEIKMIINLNQKENKSGSKVKQKTTNRFELI